MLFGVLIVAMAAVGDFVTVAVMVVGDVAVILAAIVVDGGKIADISGALVIS